MPSIAEVPPTGLGKLLTEAGFSVPTHQGNYRWTLQQAKQLFDDVLGAIDRKDDAYFVGLMVLMQSTNQREWIVLDGQQRLTTTIMILAAIRNWLRGYTEYMEFARQLQDTYIGNKEFGETKINPRLCLNVANHDAFEAHVVNEIPLEKTTAYVKALKRHDPNKGMLEVALYCNTRLAEILKGKPTKEAFEIIKTLVKYLRDNVIVIRLVVSSDANAYTIFETLNDRGLELTPLDLVKNYLFGRVDTGKHGMRLKNMEARWVQMLGTLTNVKPVSFLKAYWTSRHGRIQTSNLFETLKEKYKSSDDAEKLSIEMLSVAEQYTALDSYDDPIWSNYPTRVRETVRSLKILGAQQSHSVLLAALAMFDAGEFDRLIRLMETIIVRYQLIGGGRTGALEIACARLAPMIFEKKITSAGKAFPELKDVYPDDDEFQAAFALKEETDNPTVAYLLKRLEKQERINVDGAKAKDLDPGAALAVEHILPRNPTEDWTKIFPDEDERGSAIYRLGNLCLLSQDKLGRKKFELKKPTFAASDLHLTSDIAKQADWNFKAIEWRQAKLAKLAPSVWRYP